MNYTYLNNKILERVLLIEIVTVKSLLRKALIYRIMVKVDELVVEANLTHKEISEQTGREGNWVNRIYNDSSDMTVSSLAKILSVINQKVCLEDIGLNRVFNTEVLKVAKVMSQVADENTDSISSFILSEKLIFSDLMGGLGALRERNKLTAAEKEVLEKIEDLLKTN